MFSVFCDVRYSIVNLGMPGQDGIFTYTGVNQAGMHPDLCARLAFMCTTLYLLHVYLAVMILMTFVILLKFSTITCEIDKLHFLLVFKLS